MAMKIRKGDTVFVLKGKNRGQTGEVLSVKPEQKRVTVRGINMIKRHTKASRDKDGGIISREASIDISNVAYLDPENKKPVRIGFKIENEKKQRYAKRSGKVIGS